MKRTLGFLILILLIRGCFALALILSGTIGLGPDEAQYWTWSQALDFGYYSKPPAIAWQIWLGTEIFGNTELGVRFFAAVIAFVLPIAVYYLAKACSLCEKAAFWAALAVALSPFGLISSLLATTDGGLVLFWTLSCLVIAQALTDEKTPDYLLIGALILCGSLFKWPIYILWPLVFLGMAAFPGLRSRKVVAGVAISLIGLVPSVYWNASHEWATFRHVFSTIAGGHGGEAGTAPFIKGNFFEFLAAQAALFSPILFALLLFAFASLAKQRRGAPPAILFCGGAAFLLLAAYSALAVFQKMQGNWCIFIYPMGAVLVAWFCFEKVSWGKMWLKGGVAVSCILSLLVVSIPFAQAYSLGYIPYKINPFRHNVGWDLMEQDLKEAGYDPEKEFLFGDKYQMASLASFYSPGKKRAYFFNIGSARKNQFSYWPGMDREQVGKTGYFLVAENEPHLKGLLERGAKKYRRELEAYFEKVEYLGVFPLFYNHHRLVKGLLIFKCENYNGKVPETTDLF